MLPTYATYLRHLPTQPTYTTYLNHLPTPTTHATYLRHLHEPPTYTTYLRHLPHVSSIYHMITPLCAIHLRYLRRSLTTPRTYAIYLRHSAMPRNSAIWLEFHVSIVISCNPASHTYAEPHTRTIDLCHRPTLPYYVTCIFYIPTPPRYATY